MAGYIPRYVDRAINRLLTELPAVMLVGPRGCGKTTSALRVASSVLRLDRPDQAAAFAADPDAILATSEPVVLIDEWQAVPAAMGAVKRAVDADHDVGRFVLTGSVRARLGSAGWPGTGRVVPLPMYGLTVAESLGRADVIDPLGALLADVDPVPGSMPTAPSLPEIVDLALRGGYPDAISLSDDVRAAWYDGYVDQLIRHDVPEVADLRAPAAMVTLLRAVSLNTAGLPSLTTLSEAAGLAHRTAVTYLDLLEDLRIIERVPAWSDNKFSRLVKGAKFYVVDSGLAAHLAGDTRATVLKSGDRLGRLIDTFVSAQIRPLLRLRRPAITAYHLRDTNQNREVDVVLETASGDVAGIEVKAANRVDQRDARHLAWLRDQLGDRFRRGIVLHTGSMTYRLGDRLWAVPVARLWTA